MASISKQRNGRRTIQFFGPDKKRRSIRLGKVSDRMARSIKVKVEDLVSAAIAKQPVSDETARWVAQLDDEMTGKLSRVGLIRERQNPSLAKFLDNYIESRQDVEAGTRSNYQQVKQNLVDFFGPDKRLCDITPGDADKFKLWLLTEANSTTEGGLADSTANRRIRRAKQFFTAAVRSRLIPSSPFEDVKAGQQANAERFHFVTREDTAKVLEACPDAQWRAIVALARFGGLRTPSETLALEWGHFNLDALRALRDPKGFSEHPEDYADAKITVTSPKTRKVGKPSRVVPLFPELVPYLADLLELAEPEARYVITRYRNGRSNLRPQLLRIIRKAGVSEWPKPYQNMRSTRETELADQFPIHVVCEWIGNTEAVARKHYLQITDKHFAKAVQKAVQQSAADGGTASHEGSTKAEKRAEKRGDAVLCDTLQEGQATQVGCGQARHPQPGPQCQHVHGRCSLLRHDRPSAGPP